jgi:hypothetical protein
MAVNSDCVSCVVNRELPCIRNRLSFYVFQMECEERPLDQVFDRCLVSDPCEHQFTVDASSIAAEGASCSGLW